MPKIQYLHKTRQGIPDIYAQMFGDILQNMNFSRYYRNRGKFIYGFDPNIIELKDSILEKPVILENISQKIKIDSDKDIITGLNSPDDFNWHFMKLADGNNIITTDSVDNIDIEIQYREPRYVRV